MVKYNISIEDVHAVFWKKNSLFIIPSIILGLLIVLIQYWNNLNSKQMLLLVAIVCLVLLPISLFLGYVLLKKSLLGVKIIINDEFISYYQNNGHETKINFDEFPIIKKGINGVVIVKDKRQIIIPSQISIYILIIKELNC